MRLFERKFRACGFFMFFHYETVLNGVDDNINREQHMQGLRQRWDIQLDKKTRKQWKKLAKIFRQTPLHATLRQYHSRSLVIEDKQRQKELSAILWTWIIATIWTYDY